MRRCLSPVLCAVVLTVAVPAAAQDPNCPPGAWFCEETEVQAPPSAAPAAPPTEAAPAQPPAKTPSGRGAVVLQPENRAAPPPVVVYQPVPNGPPPQVIIVSPGARARAVYPVPPPPPKRNVWRREWGLNLRLQGLVLEREGGAEDAGMGGIGLGLRYRPVPHFAIEGGIDLIGGTDYNGFERAEIPLSLNGIFYVNPRSKVQFYLMGGIHGAWAKVRSDTYSPLLTHNDTQNTWDDGFEQEYSYFGGQGGIGLEFRLSRRVALNIDGVAFMRSRTDDGELPEYVNKETGETTNTSGGGLIRGGITFWW